MNNDTNNNQNGMVLGDVTNNPPQEGQTVQETEVLESLDTPVNPEGTVLAGTTPNPNVEPKVEVQPNVQPDVAYTNTQAISPINLENPGQIGLTPPISLQEEKKPKKKLNKYVFLLIVIALLAAVGFGTYFLLNYTEFLKFKEKVSVTINNLTYEAGATLPTSVEEYATVVGTSSKNCSVNTSEVDVNTVGRYKFTVKCGKIERSGVVEIIDAEELVVNLKTVYKYKGETVSATEFAIDNNLEYEFVDENEVNEILQKDAGTYTVKLKVSGNKKTTEVEGNLVIIQYRIKGYLKCNTKEQNISDDKIAMQVTEIFGLFDDGNNTFSGITEEIYTFKFTDDTEYNKYVTEYETDKELTINNVSGMPKFDAASYTITLIKNRDKADVLKEYGEENMKTYGTIINHFATTLGYNCVYEKAN